jgi:hypothetical protein
MIRGVWVVGLVVGSVLGLAACQGGSGGPAAASFDAKAAEYGRKAGRGRIDGQAFVRRDYGRPVTAAGERVFLIPATPYAVDRFSRMFGGERRSYYGAAVEEPPPEYFDYRRETKVDMAGKFAFENLAPGRYIVATRVFWTEPKSFLTHGGAIYDVVDVRDDETTAAIVSGK